MTEHLRKFLVSSTAVLTLSMSFAAPALAAEEDPYERTNRSVYEFNNAIDRAVFKPLAKGYRAITPRPLRKGITNVLNNLREPFTFVNALLQAKPKYAIRAVGRFAVNTTAGLGGLFDPAKKMGMEPHSEDFGQTLAVWGIPEGPYLMLPFIGPSNPRDAVGFVVQFFGDPADILITDEFGKKAHYAVLGTRVVDFRATALETVDPLLDTSDDPYVFIRSAYRQKRNFDISNGAVPLPSEEDDIFGDAQPEPMTETATAEAAPLAEGETAAAVQTSAEAATQTVADTSAAADPLAAPSDVAAAPAADAAAQAAAATGTAAETVAAPK